MGSSVEEASRIFDARPLSRTTPKAAPSTPQTRPRGPARHHRQPRLLPTSRPHVRPPRPDRRPRNRRRTPPRQALPVAGRQVTSPLTNASLRRQGAQGVPRATATTPVLAGPRSRTVVGAETEPSACRSSPCSEPSSANTSPAATGIPAQPPTGICPPGVVVSASRDMQSILSGGRWAALSAAEDRPCRAGQDAIELPRAHRSSSSCWSLRARRSPSARPTVIGADWLGLRERTATGQPPDGPPPRPWCRSKPAKQCGQ